MKVCPNPWFLAMKLRCLGAGVGEGRSVVHGEGKK